MIAKRWTEIVKTCSTRRLSVYNNTVVSLLSEWFSSLWNFALLYGRFLLAKNSPRASLSMCGISTQILFSGAVCSLTGNRGQSIVFSSFLKSDHIVCAGYKRRRRRPGQHRCLKVTFCLIFSHFCCNLWNRLLNVPCYWNGLVIVVYVQGWQPP